eukprot:403332325
MKNFYTNRNVNFLKFFQSSKNEDLEYKYRFNQDVFNKRDFFMHKRSQSQQRNKIDLQTVKEKLLDQSIFLDEKVWLDSHFSRQENVSSPSKKQKNTRFSLNNSINMQKLYVLPSDFQIKTSTANPSIFNSIKKRRFQNYTEYKKPLQIQVNYDKQKPSQDMDQSTPLSSRKQKLSFNNTQPSKVLENTNLYITPQNQNEKSFQDTNYLAAFNKNTVQRPSESLSKQTSPNQTYRAIRKNNQEFNGKIESKESTQGGEGRFRESQEKIRISKIDDQQSA